MEWVVLLIIIVILGALAGGNSLGETIRNGVGCLLALILLALAFALLVGVSS